MTKLKKIPEFKTIAQEARFWDTHDISDFLPEMKEVGMVYSPSSPKKETLTIRVQADLKKRLEKTAKIYGVPLSTLLRIWFIDKLANSETTAIPA